MTGQPHVLATSCTEPDQEFATLRALALAVLKRRELIPGDPELKLSIATVSRGELPGGQCVAVRALDGSHAGKGVLIGYAFMPGVHGEKALRLLMAAILALAGAEARAA